jgi:hypothetical protein
VGETTVRGATLILGAAGRLNELMAMALLLLKAARAMAIDVIRYAHFICLYPFG